MIIILEGPDGAGKSYLADKLKEKGFHLAEKSTEGGYEENKKKVQDMVDNVSFQEEIVFDRLPFISEMIYGPVLRDESRNNYQEAYNILNDLSRSTVVIVLFVYSDGSRELKLEAKSWKDEKMVEKVTHMAPTIRYEYDQLAQRLGRGFGDNSSVGIMAYTNQFNDESTKAIMDSLCVE